MSAQKNITNNRKASYNYELVDRIVAGVELMGTEVKSLRSGNVTFGDSFCVIHNGEISVKSLHIPVYDKGNIHNHEPLRSRKLLMRKAEIKKLDKKVKEKGFTLIPTKLYFSKRGWVKIEIATARGKKTFDKRDSIKQKDLSKQMKKLDY